MSTRSRIGKLNRDGSITNIYCHSDGYLGGVGWTLFHNYKTSRKVNMLLKLGNISSLEKHIGQKHDFEARNFHPNWTTAYTRDRGDLNQETITNVDETEFFAKAKKTWADCVYVWKNKQWYYCDMYNRERLNMEMILEPLTLEILHNQPLQEEIE